MCAIAIWAVNTSAFTDEFRSRTELRLGVAPRPTEYRIVSHEVRPTAKHFTLTRNACDCDGLVGLGARQLRLDETSAESLTQWIATLPETAPHLSRLVVLRAWSPTERAISPARVRSALVGDVDQPLLRSIGDDTLLTIDYPMHI